MLEQMTWVVLIGLAQRRVNELITNEILTSSKTDPFKHSNKHVYMHDQRLKFLTNE